MNTKIGLNPYVFEFLVHVTSQPRLSLSLVLAKRQFTPGSILSQAANGSIHLERQLWKPSPPAAFHVSISIDMPTVIIKLWLQPDEAKGR